MNNQKTKPIKILEVQQFSEQELIDRLRKLTMLEDKETKPYEKTFISMENICIDDLFPPQRYVLKSELMKVRELKWRLEEQGIDIFNLNGFIRVKLDGNREPIDLLPPVVEE
ncbi:MAG TPA: hypothetical protein ENG35_06835, partial [Desulfobacteraceae bacterium]|nr:hypothetical protein [Desulfobacteraceae bacterium]